MDGLRAAMASSTDPDRKSVLTYRSLDSDIAEIGEEKEQIRRQRDRESRGKATEGRYPPRFSDDELGHGREQQEIAHGIGDGDQFRQDSGARVDAKRVDHVDPQEQARAGREDHGVEQGTRVPLGEPAA
jgi:hypothetical protein